jgi:multidrug efflux system membrane fusion protein
MKILNNLHRFNLSVGLLWLLLVPTSTIAEVPTVDVEVTVADSSTTRLTREFLGKVRLNNHVTVVARVKGHIKEVLFKDGDNVAKNQVLSQLDKESFLIEVARKNAIYRRTMAELEDAKRRLALNHPLLTSGNISTSTIEDLETEIKIKSSSLEIARQEKKHAESQLQYATIMSPINGVVQQSLVQSGDFVIHEKTILTEVISDSEIFVDVRISGAYYLDNSDKIIRGDRQIVTVSSRQNSSFPASVHFISSEVEPASGSVLVVLEL